MTWQIAKCKSVWPSVVVVILTIFVSLFIILKFKALSCVHLQTLLFDYAPLGWMRSLQIFFNFKTNLKMGRKI